MLFDIFTKKSTHTHTHAQTGYADASPPPLHTTFEKRKKKSKKQHTVLLIGFHVTDTIINLLGVSVCRLLTVSSCLRRPSHNQCVSPLVSSLLNNVECVGTGAFECWLPVFAFSHSGLPISWRMHTTQMPTADSEIFDWTNDVTCSTTCSFS